MKEAEAWCAYLHGYTTNKLTGSYCDMGFCKNCKWRADRIKESGMLPEEED